jgi:hypothetical protein
MREGCLGSSQLTSEKKPRFSGSNQPLPVPLIVFRLREFLVGLRSTLGGCQHCIPAVILRKHLHSEWPRGESVQNRTHMKLFKMSYLSKRL